MARTIHKLTDATCRSETKPGLLGDGGGLYLNIKKTGAKSWTFIWRDGTKRSEMGLGSYPTITLSRARTLAHEAREGVANGRNPIRDKNRQKEPTFKECVAEFLASVEGQWRNEKHRAQWKTTLSTYCKSIENMKVSKIGTDEILALLKPIWNTKAETASRLRGRIERVFDYARAKGWRSDENPALWRGHLKNVLPVRQRLTRGHHSAMAYTEVPSFMAELKTKEALAARALELLILTAARSGEVYGATWDEIDLENKIWTIPASRMKATREHRVPLTSPSQDILQYLKDLRQSQYVFPGQRKDRPLSGMAMTMLMRRMGHGNLTVHGFRSAFRDWAGDATSHPREVAEAALAHAVGDMTERAYRRGDALEKRRKLMEDWANFLLRTAE